MKPSEMAQIMGRNGGLKRAKRLSPQRRKEIAQKGAAARAESLRLAKIIESNFQHLKAIRELQNA